VSVPALGLLGGFVAYQAQASPPGPATGSQAAYHLRTLTPGAALTAGSGTPITGRTSPSQAGKTTKTTKAAATAGKSRQAIRAGSAHRTAGTTAAPAASSSPSPQASQSPTPSPTPSKNSQASLKAAVKADIASGNYLLAVGQYLVENGYSDAAAAGVASCIDGESGGNPESVGSGGGGLIGWTPLSSAEPNSNIITGNDAQDMMAQLADLLYYNSTEIGQSLVNQLDAISDPVAAADFFSQNFERPAITDSDVVPSVAEQIYSDLKD
jgi:Phage tail lysozyme